MILIATVARAAAVPGDATRLLGAVRQCDVMSGAGAPRRYDLEHATPPRPSHHNFNDTIRYPTFGPGSCNNYVDCRNAQELEIKFSKMSKVNRSVKMIYATNFFYPR